MLNIICLLIGSFIGVITMCLFSINNEDYEEYKTEEEGETND